MMRTRATLITFLCAAACGDPTQRDAPPDVLQGAIALRLGGERAGPELGYVSGLATAADGRIVAADRRAHQVHVYAADGRHAFSFGTQGAGPSDFSSPCCLTFDAQGLLWVRDEGNARFVAFRLEADRATLAYLVRGGPNVASTAERLDTEGELLIDLQAAGVPGTGRIQTLRVFLARDGRGVRVDTLHLPPSDSLGDVRIALTGGFATYSQPFGAVALSAVGGGGQVASAVSTQYAMQWLRPGAAPVQITRPTPTGPAVDSAERRETEEWLAILERTHGKPRSELGLSVPERKAPLHALGFDLGGRLWVTFTTAAGAPHEADVFTGGASSPIHVMWPGAVELRTLAVRDTVGLGVEIAPDGGESIVVLRWRKKG
jgi:hypothetical protein